MPNARDVIATESAVVGIPEWIPTFIAMRESGLNTFNVTKDSNGYDSVGLFQLNLNGLGKGHSIVDLENATKNADIAIPAMMPAYKAGMEKGLQGKELLDYVANNSGWPDSNGVTYTQNVEPAYDEKLNQIYDQHAKEYRDATTGVAPGSNLLQKGVVGMSTGNWSYLFAGNGWVKYAVMVAGIGLATVAVYRLATK